MLQRKRAGRIGVIMTAIIIASVILFLPMGCKKTPSLSEGPSLKGFNVVVGNWWADYDVNTQTADNDTAEKTLEWRTKIQKDNGFTMTEKNVAGWDEYLQNAVTSIMAGSPAASVFFVQPDWAMALITQGLAYPISDSSVNLRNAQPAEAGMYAPRWNTAAMDAMTFGGKTYAFSEGVNLNNAQVVFFNKRLFREAGLDPDTPYNMQRDGTWTWENFLDICKKLTRDVNNDGIIDVYAMASDKKDEYVDAFAASNGAKYVDKDSTGKYVNATNRPEFLEALQFILRLNNEGVMRPVPADANWDWYKADFTDGNSAMRIDESYVWQELGRDNMRDDWGVVLPPKGPRSSTYHVLTRENYYVIPATFSKEQVDQILTAMNLWMTPMTDANDWKAGYYNYFRDSRAVDETLTLMRDTSIHMNKDVLMVPSIQRGDLAWNVLNEGQDPAQLVESVSQDWNYKINELNSQLPK